MNPSPGSRDLKDDVAAGQAVYTRRVLSAYDILVLGISNRLIWKCPTSRLVAMYDKSVSGNHLDVGVGTGYFLDRCRFPNDHPRVALMDLNENSLDYAADRIKRFTPETYQQNVLEEVAIDAATFDSIGINYLLHCLPGSLDEKSVIFDHLMPWLRPGGVVFGSTLLQGGVKRGFAARRLMNFYNTKGIFCNKEDNLETLKEELHKRFTNVAIDVVGCAAVFRGYRR